MEQVSTTSPPDQYPKMYDELDKCTLITQFDAVVIPPDSENAYRKSHHKKFSYVSRFMPGCDADSWRSTI